MFSRGKRKRARPPALVLMWSALVVFATLTVALLLFQDLVFIPIVGWVLVASAIAAVRTKWLHDKLPEPYGKGRVVEVDASASQTFGVILVLGGLGFFVLLLGSIFFLPPFTFFVVMFSIVGGLPLSQLVYFSTVAYLERRCNGRIYSVTADDEKEGKEVLLRFAEVQSNGN